MESVVKYIVSLLERHECVVVPDFGGFVLQPQPSQFSSSRQELRPASKMVSFNRSLQMNDGLLVKEVSQQETISYNEASEEVNRMVSDWKWSLHSNGSLQLKDLGEFTVGEEGNLVFEPSFERNYLKSAYGLTSLTLIPIDEEHSALPKEFATTRKLFANPAVQRRIRKVTASAAIAASIILSGVLVSRYIPHGSGAAQTVAEVKMPAQQQQNIQVPPVHTAPVMSTPSESINTIISETGKAASTAVSAHNLQYYIIGGSFSTRRHADKFVSELAEKGYKAEILNNESGFFRVAYTKEKDSVSADQYLQKIKIEENQAAWLLKW